VKTIDDLGKQFCRELEEFFVNYHELSGAKYRVLDVKGPDKARKLVEASCNEGKLLLLAWACPISFQ